MSTLARLPDDFSRCRGVGDDAEGWREGCEDCARRLAPASEHASHIEPPPIITFWCEYHIGSPPTGTATGMANELGGAVAKDDG